MRRAGAWLVGGAALASAACEGQELLPPAPQLIVYIDTDAIIPSEVLVPTTALDPPPLFDTLEIEGVHDGAVCATCTRELSVFSEKFRDKSVSFGIVAPVSPGDSLRVKLYLSTYAIGGPAPPEATIDVTVALPPLPATGTLEETLLLLTDDVGALRQGQLTEGAPTTSRVGTWAGARRVDCPAPARPGEVCAPGGAYWMGNPLVAHLGNEDGDRLRLVTLAPFYVDSEEVTVARYRPLVNTIGLGEEWSKMIGCYEEDYCTFTPEPGPHDDYPMNCVTAQSAAMFCAMQGEELPTEAQFEYLASGLASHSFVWGEDPPACADAVLTRAGLGYFGDGDGECNPADDGPAPGPADSCGGFPPGGLPEGGPERVRSGRRDQLTIALPSSTGTIYDLVGNVSEATRDDWSLLSGACWSKPGVYVDPVCVVPSCLVSVPITIRGGNWTATGADARAAARNEVLSGDFSAQLGFRCVRAAK